MWFIEFLLENKRIHDSLMQLSDTFEIVHFLK